MFTPKPIGYVSSPYRHTSEIPKGLNAKHDAEGVLCILREFELGLTDIEGFLTCSSFGNSTALRITNCSVHRPSIIARTGYLPRGRHAARILSVLRSWNYCGAKMPICTCAA